MDCRWLTKNQMNQEARRNKYCPNMEIREACKKTCENCACRDDLNFMFPIDNGLVQDCSWLLRQPSRIDARRKNYCNKTVSGRLVYDACRIGCGVCYYPIEPPSEEGRTDIIVEPLLDEGRIDTTVESSLAEAGNSQLKKKSFFKDFLWGR